MEIWLQIVLGCVIGLVISAVVMVLAGCYVEWSEGGESFRWQVLSRKRRKQTESRTHESPVRSYNGSVEYDLGSKWKFYREDVLAQVQGLTSEQMTDEMRHQVAQEILGRMEPLLLNPHGSLGKLVKNQQIRMKGPVLVAIHESHTAEERLKLYEYGLLSDRAWQDLQLIAEVLSSWYVWRM